MAYNFKRLAPLPTRQVSKSDVMRFGPVELGLREGKILLEYLKDFNATQAAIRAGEPKASAAWMGSVIIKKPKVLLALHYAVKERRQRLEIDVDEVANYWYSLATADVRELNPLYYGACRYCHGIDHQWQLTQEEMRDRLRKHEHRYRKVPPSDRPMFDELGGDGYDKTLPPDPDCPECNGHGLPQVKPIDLNKLSYGAALAYDGIKINRDGSYEFKLRDRSRAMENLQVLLGFIRPRRGKWDLNFDEMSDEQLDALIAEASNRGLLRPDDFPGRVIDVNSEEVENEHPRSGEKIA